MRFDRGQGEFGLGFALGLSNPNPSRSAPLTLAWLTRPPGEWSYWPASMYCLAPYFEEGERIVHARRGIASGLGLGLG